MTRLASDRGRNVTDGTSEYHAMLDLQPAVAFNEHGLEDEFIL